jgi:DUF971 family protein
VVILDPRARQPLDVEIVNDSDISISWADGHIGFFPGRFLRLECKCAECVHEMTGEPILDPESVSDDVAPESVDPVGRYAIKITWNDGHSNGIYPYARLREICRCDACLADRAAKSD